MNAPTPPSLTTKKAHSGNYSVVVQPGTEYGLGYSAPLNQLSPTRPSHITLSAWVFVPGKDAQAVLVTDIKAPGAEKPLLWESINVAEAVTNYNEWQRIEKTIPIPAEATALCTIQLYPWLSNSQQAVYFDDMAITLAD